MKESDPLVRGTDPGSGSGSAPKYHDFEARLQSFDLR